MATKVKPIVWIAGIVGFLVVAALIVLVVALPRNSRTTQFAGDLGALKSIITIHTAEAQYHSEFGKYAGTLAALGPLASGTTGPAADDLIPAAQASGESSGYRFSLALAGDGYTIHANPITFGTTGSRTFFSDQTLVIHQHHGEEPASAADPELK